MNFLQSWKTVWRYTAKHRRTHREVCWTGCCHEVTSKRGIRLAWNKQCVYVSFPRLATKNVLGKPFKIIHFICTLDNLVFLVGTTWLKIKEICRLLSIRVLKKLLLQIGVCCVDNQNVYLFILSDGNLQYPQTLSLAMQLIFLLRTIFHSCLPYNERHAQCNI